MDSECAPRIWTEGIPYAGWIVADLRSGRGAQIVAVVAEHDPRCDIDHGNTRHIFARREFTDDQAYSQLVELGYANFSVVNFVRYPGGEGVLRTLKLIRPLMLRGRWQDILCLRYERPFTDIGELIAAEATAFGRDAFKIPEVIGIATGPIPRPDAAMPMSN